MDLPYNLDEVGDFAKPLSHDIFKYAPQYLEVYVKQKFDEFKKTKDKGGFIAWHNIKNLIMNDRDLCNLIGVRYFDLSLECKHPLDKRYEILPLEEKNNIARLRLDVLALELLYDNPEYFR